MAKRTKYHDLHLIPTIIADGVIETPYKMQEYSEYLYSQKEVDKVEKLRLALTFEQKREFADYVENRCELAYRAKAEWFEKCIKAKGDIGREQLKMWITHWMCAYLKFGING